MKNEAAVKLGSKGGKARAKKLTAAQRKASARKAWLASAKARKKKKLTELEKERLALKAFMERPDWTCRECKTVIKRPLLIQKVYRHLIGRAHGMSDHDANEIIRTGE